MTKQQPLRKPKNSVPTAQNQYAEIKEVWRDFRERVLALKREDYMTKGKGVARELQLCMQKNQRDVNKIVHIVYERAAKDLHTYPIAALLFEDLGNEVENTYGGEKILDELQKQIQRSLSALNAKLGKMEKLLGTDVGIIFLLFLLYKLENLRKGDGSFFRDLLMKLFKEFHVYMLGASKWPHSDFSSTVLSAVCVLMHIADSEKSDAKLNYKVKQVLGMLRGFIIHGSLKGAGKIQVLWTIESLVPGKSHGDKDDFYRQKYISACKRSIYLIDSLDHVLSDTQTEKKNSKEEDFSSNREVEEDSLNTSDGSSDVFLDEEIKSGQGSARESSEIKRTGHDQERTSPVSFTTNKISDNTTDSGSKDNLPIQCQQAADVKEIKASTATRSFKESVSSAELRRLIEIGTNESNETQAEITELIKVPDECLERIVGYEGAILRKLEYQSQAKIKLDWDKIEESDNVRPETSSLTAHRLVAGALGLPSNIDKDKKEIEKEKLSFAKDVASRYKMCSKQHEVKLIGSKDAVSTAKTLINEIVNFTTFLDVPLPGFAMDEVIDISGTKLKTIETLLNVILRLEETEDDSVILHISGDRKSCEDAKKLILEELGSVYAMQGQLLLLPRSLKSILVTKDLLDMFVSKLVELSNANIRVFKNEKGLQFLFFTGYSDRVLKAHRLMNKINTKLLFRPTESVAGSDGDDGDKQESISVEDVLRMMDDIAQGTGDQSLSRQVSQDPTSAVKRQTYSRDFLVHCANAPSSWRFPSSLQQILDGNDEECKQIILKEGIDIRDLLALTSQGSSPRRLSTFSSCS